ncbi:hypothetical protein MTO96_010261 [Rhipicephalus appendiculatus]
MESAEESLRSIAASVPRMRSPARHRGAAGAQMFIITSGPAAHNERILPVRHKRAEWRGGTKVGEGLSADSYETRSESADKVVGR